MPGQPDRADEVPAGNRQAELAAFWVVANIAEETAHGEGGLQLHGGVKHFPPGARSGSCRRSGATEAIS